MSRPFLAVFLVLAVALVVLGILADRALVQEASAAAALAAARTEEDARAAAFSVRGALGQIEQELLAGRRPGRVRIETLALPPAPSLPRGRPYRERPRSELIALLTSTEATSGGLPEAVVAALALGVPAYRRDVRERLVDGELSVHPDDVVDVGRLLIGRSDSRLRDLQARLRRLPAPADLPAAPTFKRVVSHGSLAGWTRLGRTYIRYDAALPDLLEAAGVAGRARAADAGTAVPDVEGLRLAVEPAAPPGRRLAAGRALLWPAVGTCLAALAFMQRALSREARAVAREKAFLAGVTHELRTPVAAIRVFGEALADGSGDAREYGALLAEESDRLEALVERVLAATRLDEAPCLAEVRPADLLTSAVELMRPRAARCGVMLRLRVEEDAGHAHWDGDAVRRALLNLIDNAIKHGRPQGLVEARARADEREVWLSVRDDGPGIARHDQQRLFGRFQRGPTEAPGAGLGLYLVDQVARAHGGRVDLMAGQPHGCTFILVLPRRPPALPGAPA